MGCQLEVTIENGEATTVKGNTCPRSMQNECTNPQRMVTTTVMCENGELLPVKIDRPVKKDDVFKVMEIVNNSVARVPIKIKDIIIENVCGANIIATKNFD